MGVTFMQIAGFSFLAVGSRRSYLHQFHHAVVLVAHIMAMLYQGTCIVQRLLQELHYFAVIV